MRLSKFLSIISFATFISCLYVYQQTEILRLAYIGQKKKVVFEESLDKNSFLRYNLESGISLVRIGDRVSKVADFQMPDTYRLVRLAPSQGNSKLRTQGPKKKNILVRLFSIKRQAEAKTINTSTRLSVNGERPSTSLGTSPEFIEGRSRTINP